LVGSFSISGVPNLIDLTYDGTYFYGQGQSPTNVIYQMDFTTHTLVGTIPSPHAAWNIAYDAVNDGFWIGQWQNYCDLISRDGTIIDSITPVPDSMLGFAWDPYTQIDGYTGPFLWVATGTSTGMPNTIKVIDLPTHTLIPGVQHNVAAELGDGMAGGLELVTTYNPDKAILVGITQGTTNDYAFGYEMWPLYDSQPPVTTISLNGTMDGSKYTSDVTVTLTAVDTGVGLNQTFYKLDGGVWTVYSGPFVVKGNGKHTVGYYSTDLNGNTEADQTTEFTIAYPLEITIKGGLGVTVKVTNNGTEAVDFDGTISFDGLIFPRSKAISATAVDPGVTKSFHLFTVGIDKININVAVNGWTKKATGTALLFFVLGVK